MATSYSTDKAIPWIYVTIRFLVAQLPLLILMKVFTARTLHFSGDFLMQYTMYHHCHVETSRKPINAHLKTVHSDKNSKVFTQVFMHSGNSIQYLKMLHFTKITNILYF